MFFFRKIASNQITRVTWDSLNEISSRPGSAIDLKWCEEWDLGLSISSGKLKFGASDESVWQESSESSWCKATRFEDNFETEKDLLLCRRFSINSSLESVSTGPNRDKVECKKDN